MSTHTIRLVLNGSRQEHEVPAELLLIDLIRDRCGLTGTKLGCSVGVCGACSVLVDGVLLSACLVPAVHVDGRSIGAARDGLWHLDLLRQRSRVGW